VSLTRGGLLAAAIDLTERHLGILPVTTGIAAWGCRAHALGETAAEGQAVRPARATAAPPGVAVEADSSFPARLRHRANPRASPVAKIVHAHLLGCARHLPLSMVRPASRKTSAHLEKKAFVVGSRRIARR